jgi:hypothetical protein
MGIVVGRVSRETSSKASDIERILSAIASSRFVASIAGHSA